MTKADLVEQLKKLDCKDEVYLDKVKALLKEGLDPNAVDEYGCLVLGECVFNWFCEEACPPVIDLIKLFVKYGYDVKSRNGQSGSDLLSQLTAPMVIDDKIIEITDYVLKLGADPTVIYDGDSALSWAGSTSNDGWSLGDYVTGCLGDILWRIFYRASQKQSYQGIRTHQTYVGKKIVDAKIVFRSEEYFQNYGIVTDENLKAALDKGELLLYVEDEETPLSMYRASSLVADPYWNWTGYYTTDYLAFGDLTIAKNWIGRKIEKIDVSFGRGECGCGEGMKLHLTDNGAISVP